jgi:hypothetical protein
MGMRINAAWDDHPASRVDDLCVRSAEITPNGRNGAVHNENIGLIRVYRSEHAAVLDKCTHP